MKFKFMAILFFFSTPFYGCNNSPEKKNKNEIKSILILGNSIVAHPPLPDIGWNHDWGMAASERDSDFVHRLEVNIHQVDPSINVAWKSISAFERDYETYDLSLLSDYCDFDMIVVKISENVAYEPTMKKSFLNSYDNLLNFLTQDRSAVIIITEGFWPTPVNELIKEYALGNRLPFIPLADLYENNKSNAAIGLFENEGVSRHPSDKGMKNIAARIWNVLEKYL